MRERAPTTAAPAAAQPSLLPSPPLSPPELTYSVVRSARLSSSPSSPASCTICSSVGSAPGAVGTPARAAASGAHRRTSRL